MEFVATTDTTSLMDALASAGARSERRRMNRGPEANFQALTSLLAGGCPKGLPLPVPALASDEMRAGDPCLVACCDAPRGIAAVDGGVRQKHLSDTAVAADRLRRTARDIPRTSAPLPKVCKMGGVEFDVSYDAPPPNDSALRLLDERMAGIVSRHTARATLVPIHCMWTAVALAQTRNPTEQPCVAPSDDVEVEELDMLVGVGARGHELIKAMDTSASLCELSFETTGPSFALFPVTEASAAVDPAAQTYNGYQIVVPLLPIYGGRTHRLSGLFKGDQRSFISAYFNVSMRRDSGALFVEFDQCPYCTRVGTFPPERDSTCFCHPMAGIPSYGNRDRVSLAMCYVVRSYPTVRPEALRQSRMTADDFKTLAISKPRGFKCTRLGRDDKTYLWWRVRLRDTPSMFECFEALLRLGESFKQRNSLEYRLAFRDVLLRMLEKGICSMAVCETYYGDDPQYAVVFPELSYNSCHIIPNLHDQQDLIYEVLMRTIRDWTSRMSFPTSALLRIYLCRARGYQCRRELAEYLLGFHRKLEGMPTLQSMCRDIITRCGPALPRSWYSILSVQGASPRGTLLCDYIVV